MRMVVEKVKYDFRAFLGVDEKWYGAREAVLQDINPGDTVEFDLEVNGKWNNIVGDKIRVVPKAAASSGQSGPGRRWHAYEDRGYQNKINQRIGRQNALTNAVNAVEPLTASSDPDKYVRTVLELAESFAMWTAGVDRLAMLNARELVVESVPPVREETPFPTEEHAPSVGLKTPHFTDDISF